MALNTVSSDRLATNVKNTNFTAAEKQDLTNDIKPLLGSSGGGNKNLIINGAMQVAQRGTSSTASGYKTVDRFNVEHSGTDEAPTQAQVDVASGTTPYTLGFRKALKITNGNQTGGAGASDYIQIMQRVEAQNMATSGWNYTSSSSFITLSFYVKSSVAQVFSGSLRTADGTAYQYKFDTPSISADTWTKVTKIIPGNSNLQFNNDNGHGLDVLIYPFIGTTYTTANSDTETWIVGASNTYANNMTSTWYTTNDATFEITGVQLEVSSVATEFEHEPFDQVLRKCYRYYQPYISYAEYVAGGTGNLGMPYVSFITPMRASPTITSDHESKSSNWSFANMQFQGSATTGYYAYAISFNTSDSNYGYMRKYGYAASEL